MKYITIRRSGLVLLALGCVLLGSCLSCGCMIDAGKLAGFSNPKLRMNYNGSRGTFDMEAGTDFQGRAEGHYDPETKKVDAIIEIGSQASPVVKAEGDRAEQLVEVRQIEANMLVEMHRLVGENIRAGGESIASIGKSVAGVMRAEKIEPQPWFVRSLWTVVEVMVGLVATAYLFRLAWGYFVKTPTVQGGDVK